MKPPFTIEDIKKSPVAKINAHLFDVPKKKKTKYNNVKVEFDGRSFDSIKERDRYITLRMLQTAGDISELECQVEFILEKESEKICSYFADFVYKRNGEMIVEDVKSSMTRRLAAYRLKKKLMMACLGVEIKEV